MKVYKSEIEAGLQSQIENSKIAIACELFTKDDFTVNENRDNLLKVIAKANPNQRDLFYKHSILASVGWNANDDVFDRMETWNARNTPVDKQINFMHNELDIIGHSTQSSVYTVDGKLIPDNTTAEQLPEKFDVVTEFVLYQMWDNDERRQMMERIISEINENKWYVSMECRFPLFDYAVIDLDGSHKTVARNESTAFLSKHLKAFGGSGEYDGRKVGRLIRNFFFSGQGIVNKPANPRSIIFDNAVAFNSQGSLVIRGKNKMEDELKKQVAELQAKLDAVNAEKSKKDEDDKKMMDEKVKCAVQAQQEAEAKAVKLEASVTDKDKVIATLTTDLKDVNEKLSVATTELSAVKKAQAFSTRVGKLVTAGLSDEEAKTEAEKWSSLDDVQFDSITAIHKAKSEALKTSGKTEATEKTEANLEKAEAEVNVNMNTDTKVNAEEELKAIAEFLGHSMTFCSQANKQSK